MSKMKEKENNNKYLQELTEYLQERRFSKNTIVHKNIHVTRFFNWLTTENLTLSTCNYADLLNYIQTLKKQQFSIHNLNTHLVAVRQLYESQISLEKIDYNPAMNLYIKGKIQRLPHDLLSAKQLLNIYNNIEPQTPVQHRDKTILGIYINQGVIRKEIEQLQTSSINLEKGTITIEKNVKLAKRTLPLVSYQVMQLHKYLTEIRPQILQKSEGEKGQRLFFTLADNPRMHDSLILFLRNIKKQHPEFKSFRQIRSSVISHWIKGKPIREVQYLAGHNSITSTERYRQVDLKDLEESLKKHHPLIHIK